MAKEKESRQAEIEDMKMTVEDESGISFLFLDQFQTFEHMLAQAAEARAQKTEIVAQGDDFTAFMPYESYMRQRVGADIYEAIKPPPQKEMYMKQINEIIAHLNVLLEEKKLTEKAFIDAKDDIIDLIYGSGDATKH